MIWRSTWCKLVPCDSFFFSWSGGHRVLHTYPTRRSSDLHSSCSESAAISLSPTRAWVSAGADRDDFDLRLLFVLYKKNISGKQKWKTTNQHICKKNIDCQSWKFINDRQRYKNVQQGNWFHPRCSDWNIHLATLVALSQIRSCMSQGPL